MLKRTLYFSSPCYLHVKNRQLVYSPKETTGREETTIPVEDIGFVVIEHPQITLSMGVVSALTENNVALVFCDATHHPRSLLLNLDGNSIQSEVFASQLESSLPLKKNLWKQTVEAKILNQMLLLKKLGKKHQDLAIYRDGVKSGDPTNQEAVAARVYWKRLFSHLEFKRERDGKFPNNGLNYGYAILRAAVSRALLGSGLLATVGIHHCNRYNAYCLADDIMEPFRPYVDEVVYEISLEEPQQEELTKERKAKLLALLATDTRYPMVQRPLMVGLSQTTASLARCFRGEERKIVYPVLE